MIEDSQDTQATTGPIRPRMAHAMIDLGNETLISPAAITRLTFVGRLTLHVYLYGKRRPIVVRGERDIHYLLAELGQRGFIEGLC